MTYSSTSPSGTARPIPEIPAPRLVQNAHDFSEMMAHLRQQPILAVDTESDSLYRYTPRICLIQISAPNGKKDHSNNTQPSSTVDYLVDPLLLDSVKPLGELLADPAVEVILHAAENDILLLNRDFGFHTVNVFDTQLAARILGRNGVGLAAMLEEEFGVISDKRMQRTDWGRRPLTPQQMAYAQIDTHFLPALRLRQIDQLQDTDRWHEAQDAFALLETIEYSEPEARTVWSMRNTRDVQREQMGLLEELWLWREGMALRLNRPPFKVMNDRVLIELAQQAPTSEAVLKRVPGLSNYQFERYGQDILNAIASGKGRPLPELPPPVQRPEMLLDKRDQKLFQELRRWRSQTASERGVDPDIVFSNDILLQIVEKKPQTPLELETVRAIGHWKAETYGPAILAMIEGYR